MGTYRESSQIDRPLEEGGLAPPYTVAHPLEYEAYRFARDLSERAERFHAWAQSQPIPTRWQRLSAWLREKMRSQRH